MSRNGSGAQQIASRVTSWDGVTAQTGRRSELSFRLGGREIGQLHGETAALFEFDAPLRARLKRAGRIVDHPLYPAGKEPAVRRMLTPADSQDVVRMMRLNYDLAAGRAETLPDRVPAFAHRIVAV